MDYAKESLRLHRKWKGKFEITPTAPVSTTEDLSLAYTPGVAEPCRVIQKDIDESYNLTGRGNLCAVITDGSAVLGLGDIGPEAGMPVMEGKCVLFKAFGGVDAFPLCIKTKDVDEFVETVYNISASFGGDEDFIREQRGQLTLGDFGHQSGCQSVPGRGEFGEARVIGVQ